MSTLPTADDTPGPPHARCRKRAVQTSNAFRDSAVVTRHDDLLADKRRAGSKKGGKKGSGKKGSGKKGGLGERHLAAALLSAVGCLSLSAGSTGGCGWIAADRLDQCVRVCAVAKRSFFQQIRLHSRQQALLQNAGRTHARARAAPLRAPPAQPAPTPRARFRSQGENPRARVRSAPRGAVEFTGKRKVLVG